jgi:hypothetical protein
METLLPRNKVKIDPGIPAGNPTFQGQGQNLVLLRHCYLETLLSMNKVKIELDSGIAVFTEKWC